MRSAGCVTGVSSVALIAVFMLASSFPIHGTVWRFLYSIVLDCLARLAEVRPPASVIPVADTTIEAKAA